MATAMSDRTVAYYYDEEIGEGERREREGAGDASARRDGGRRRRTHPARAWTQPTARECDSGHTPTICGRWPGRRGGQGGRGGRVHLPFRGRPPRTHTPMGAVRLPGSLPCLLVLPLSKASAGGEGGGLWKGVGVEEDRGLFRPGRTGGRPTLEGERKRREREGANTRPTALSSHPLPSIPIPPPPQAPSTTAAATPCARTASA